LRGKDLFVVLVIDYYKEERAILDRVAALASAYPHACVEAFFPSPMLNGALNHYQVPGNKLLSPEQDAFYMFANEKFVASGGVDAGCEALRTALQAHYTITRPANHARLALAAKVEALAKLKKASSETTILNTLLFSNEPQVIRDWPASTTSGGPVPPAAAPNAHAAVPKFGALGGPSLSGGASDNEPTLAPRKMRDYGAYREVTLLGSSLPELGLEFSREGQGAVVERLAPEGIAARSNLVNEHDVVLAVRALPAYAMLAHAHQSRASSMPVPPPTPFACEQVDGNWVYRDAAKALQSITYAVGVSPPCVRGRVAVQLWPHASVCHQGLAK
jgi:hypothetical protein